MYCFFSLIFTNAILFTFFSISLYHTMIAYRQTFQNNFTKWLPIKIFPKKLNCTKMLHKCQRKRYTSCGTFFWGKAIYTKLEKTRNWWGMLSKKLTQSWSFIEIWFKFVEWIENYILDYFVRKFNVHIIKSTSENISRFKKYPTNSYFFLYTKENREKFYAVPYLNKCHTYKTSTIF